MKQTISPLATKAKNSITCLCELTERSDGAGIVALELHVQKVGLYIMNNSVTIIFWNLNDFNHTASFSWMNIGQKGRGVSHGVISSLALFSNMLLCAVLIRNRQVLQRAYNIIVLVLGIVDTLTGR